MSPLGRLLKLVIPIATFYYILNLDSWFANFLFERGDVYWGVAYMAARLAGCTWVSYRIACWIADGDRSGN